MCTDEVRDVIKCFTIVLLTLSLCINHLFSMENKEKEINDMSMEQRALTAFAQERFIKIASLEMNSANNNQFDWLQTAVGEAQIVMLGEQAHGDATAFLAKARIIKYLHEEMGFNVLAFESGFINAVFRMNDSAGETFLLKASRAVYGISGL